MQEHIFCAGALWEAASAESWMGDLPNGFLRLDLSAGGCRLLKQKLH